MEIGLSVGLKVKTTSIYGASVGNDGSSISCVGDCVDVGDCVGCVPVFVGFNDFDDLDR